MRFEFIKPMNGEYKLQLDSQCKLTKEQLEQKLLNGEYWTNTGYECGCYYIALDRKFYFVDDEDEKISETKLNSYSFFGDDVGSDRWYKLDVKRMINEKLKRLDI